MPPRDHHCGNSAVFASCDGLVLTKDPWLSVPRSRGVWLWRDYFQRRMRHTSRRLVLWQWTKGVVAHEVKRPPRTIATRQGRGGRTEARGAGAVRDVQPPLVARV